ncbi:MAG: type II toxin-antitoxin system RelB/DinJ family antitoxin [Planctomycetaceae bacterium]|jgi:DNA-damage-inducible protein J|nr:type II toxin-antitoxin system RelB/DinJ family antitoxin [Planctomycetaceae bacterium]
MTRTIQIQIDDETQNAVDSLFGSLGLDTATAVKMFFDASLAENGRPFSTNYQSLSTDLLQAIEDVQKGRNLH